MPIYVWEKHYQVKIDFSEFFVCGKCVTEIEPEAKPPVHDTD